MHFVFLPSAIAGYLSIIRLIRVSAKKIDKIVNSIFRFKGIKGIVTLKVLQYIIKTFFISHY